MAVLLGLVVGGLVVLTVKGDWVIRLWAWGVLFLAIGFVIMIIGVLAAEEHEASRFAAFVGAGLIGAGGVMALLGYVLSE